MKVGELQFQRGINELYPLKGDFSSHISPLKGSNDLDAGKTSFSDVLKSTLERTTPLKFSAHAIQRLEERQIYLTAVELDRLERGVNEVAAKGGCNSLILIDNQAYLVNIPNRTVITAMSTDSGGKNVFTNVDSVAIV